jgi:peptidoglycan/xylan/chitin deacetylase (PgdA/CDA1 family)
MCQAPAPGRGFHSPSRAHSAAVPIDVFTSATTRRAPTWTSPLLVKLSVALHLGVLVSLVLWPHSWPWAVAALVGNHAVLSACSLWPRSQWLGPNVVRLPGAAAARGEIALTIDDGPDPQVTPAVLDLLARHGVRASFFCIAERAARHPELVRRIVAEGHEVQNHTAHHDHRFSLLGTRAYRREIGAAQATLEQLAGVRPSAFRAPAGLRNPLLGPVLHHFGLTLVSWTRRGYDTRERDPARVLARLIGPSLRGGDILLLHDGHAARDAHGAAVLLGVLPGLFEQARSAGLSWTLVGTALAKADAAAERADPARPHQPRVAAPSSFSSSSPTAQTTPISSISSISPAPPTPPGLRVVLPRRAQG